MVTGPHLVEEKGHTQYGGNTPFSGDDRRMRQPATEFGDDAGDHTEEHSPRRIRRPADQDVAGNNLPEAVNSRDNPRRPTHNTRTPRRAPKDKALAPFAKNLHRTHHSLQLAPTLDVPGRR